LGQAATCGACPESRGRSVHGHQLPGHLQQPHTGPPQAVENQDGQHHNEHRQYDLRGYRIAGVKPYQRQSERSDRAQADHYRVPRIIPFFSGQARPAKPSAAKRAIQKACLEFTRTEDASPHRRAAGRRPCLMVACTIHRDLTVCLSRTQRPWSNLPGNCLKNRPGPAAATKADGAERNEKSRKRAEHPDRSLSVSFLFFRLTTLVKKTRCCALTVQRSNLPLLWLRLLPPLLRGQPLLRCSQ
jgi:hypothetical protein